MVANDANDIKAHPWFRSINWDCLNRMEPPFVPNIRKDTDTKYFDTGRAVSDWSETEEGEMDSSCELPPMTRELARKILNSPSIGICDIANKLVSGTFDTRRLRAVLEEIDNSAFGGKDREQLRLFVIQYGPEEKRRPRDLLLRSQETRFKALALRKELSFVGYTWRRRRVYNYGSIPQFEGRPGLDSHAQLVPQTAASSPDSSPAASGPCSCRDSGSTSLSSSEMPEAEDGHGKVEASYSRCNYIALEASDAPALP